MLRASSNSGVHVPTINARTAIAKPRMMIALAHGLSVFAPGSGFDKSHAIPESVLDLVREVPWGKGMAGLAAERARPVDACNIQTDSSGDVRPGARATSLQGAIVVPMLLGDEVVGTFGVGCRAERAFTPEETSWLLEFARTLAREVATK